MANLNWRDALPADLLERPLGTQDLTRISEFLLEWPNKARLLGLTDSEVENIREDNSTNELRKSAVLRRWSRKFGEEATLEGLLEIADRNGWGNFIRSVCELYGLEVREEGE